MIEEFLTDKPTVFRPDLMRGKSILISGGGSGIGRATACLFARLGAKVIISGRKLEKLSAVVDVIEAAGFDASAMVCDIREQQSVDQLFETLSDGPSIDFLINSAGGQFPQPAIEFSEKGWLTVVNTNLNGTWRMMQGAAKHWQSAQQPGGIVNIVVVPQGLQGVAHTCAARAGVIAASQSVAVEWAPMQIRINCIAPGAIQTEGWAVYDEKTRAKYPKTNPMMRAGTAWEIAESCVYLCSDAGAFVTGEVLTVDGGGQHWGEIWTTGKPEYFREASRLWDD
ncbi:MAG: SDR family oxidoreductase [Pseudomonadota bacterium]